MEKIEESVSCQTKHHSSVVKIVGLVLLATIVIVAILRDRIVNFQPRNITVVGQGRVSYLPDTAVINMAVTTDKATKADEALNGLNKKIEAISSAIKESGIDANDIQTQAYALNPQYEYNNNVQTINGYVASQTLLVKINDYGKNPDKLKQVIAVASKAGINQITNIVFDSSSLNSIKQQARLKAVQDAQQKSQDLAAAAQAKIDSIANWYESTVPSPYVNNNNGYMNSYMTTPSGQQEVVVEVSITYNIK